MAKRARDETYLDFSSTASDDERTEGVLHALGDPPVQYVYLVVECNERAGDEFRWYVRGAHAAADAAWRAAVAGMLAPRVDGADPAPHMGWLDDGACFGAVCGARCPHYYIRDRVMVLRVALGADVALGGAHPFDAARGVDAVAASDGCMRAARPAAPCPHVARN